MSYRNALDNARVNLANLSLERCVRGGCKQAGYCANEGKCMKLAALEQLPDDQIYLLITDAMRGCPLLEREIKSQGY